MENLLSSSNWINKFGIMILDEHTKKIVNQDIKNNYWVPNAMAISCFDCESKFSTFTVRQHHCRICGNIFCDNCSKKQLQMMNNNKIIKFRVCNNCFNICQNFSEYIKKKFINDEIKETYFYQNYEKLKKNHLKFLRIENEEKEYKIMESINNGYELILRNLIKSILEEYFSKSIVNKWENILFLLIKEVIDNLRTNSLYLKDSLNINEYVKIKLIPYKDNSLCKVISGFTMKNYIFSNNVKTSYVDPKILLINLENDFLKRKLDNNINSSQRSNSYIKILEKKIQILNPDIILVSNNYPKMIINNFLNNPLINDKCFIFDTKKKSFDNIARCTQNIVYPSFDLIGKDNILGKCKNFYLKDIKYKFNFQEIESLKITEKEENFKNRPYLIIFEGNTPLLFNTIILSGNDKLFLKKIKNLLKNILLPTARDLFLQKYLVYQFNMKIENINIENDNNFEVYSIFEENKKYRPKDLIEAPETRKDLDFKISTKMSNNNILKNLKMRQTYEIVNRLLSKERRSEKKSYKTSVNNIKNNFENYTNFFCKGFDLSITCKKCEFINYSLIKISKTNIKKNINQLIEENSLDISDDDVNFSQVMRKSVQISSKSKIEKNVHKNIGKYCKYPSKIFLSFFCDNKSYDKPLGRFIFDLCKESETNCKVCGIQLSKHVHYLYKSNGRIQIKLLSEKENNLDKIVNYLKKNDSFIINNKIPNEDNFFEIYTYGYCKICQDITTPLFRLSNEVLNYSTSKFFRFLLENINVENNFRDYSYNINNLSNHNKCTHFINKDVSRIFVTKYGSWLFEYNNISKYFFSPLNINNKIGNINVKGENIGNSNNLIEQYMNEAHNNSKEILDMLNNLFKKQISGLDILLNDEKLYLFKTSINLLINIIIIELKLIEEFKLNIIQVYLNKDYIISSNLNLLNYIAIIKNIYLKIIKIKTISNIVDKYIIEINTISDILNQKIPFSYEENLKLLEGKNEDIPIELQLFDIKVDKNPKININFENNPIYLKIISFLEYYDEKHSNYSCEYINHDLSCLLAIALSSDDYINFLKKENNNIQFSDIIVKREPNELNYEYIKNYLYSKKNDVIYLNMHKRKEKKYFEEGEIKEKLQHNKQKFENALIFNLSKNTFFDKNNKNINKEEEIIKFLESELISDNKEDFNYTLINDFSNLFFNSNNNNNYFKNSLKTNKDENEKDGHNKNMLNNIRELNDINKEINNIKKKISEFNSLFIEHQRELNSIIKSLLKPKIIKKNSFKRKSSQSTKDIKAEFGFNKKRKSSTSSKKLFDDEYEPKSFDIQNNYLLNMLNENDNYQVNNNVIPSFPFIPEFLKIFELKKQKYYEEKIMEKKYPEFLIKIYFPRQFEALRTTFCATNEEFIESIRKSLEWKITGGKSNANFWKTYDSKYVIKNISEMEFNMFIDSALNYFKHISKYLFHQKTSALGKILGAYNIKIKIQGEKEKNYYLVLMENIYYGMLSNINNFTFNCSESNIMVYDLKGSKINRYIQPKMKVQGKVLLDTNFLEDFNGEPLFFDFNVFQSLKEALNNDSFFLKDEGIIDYSLLIIFENDNNKNKNEIKENNSFKIIKLGIVDYLRKYTWDKQIESYSKKFINGFSNPTIINPESYRKRFMDKIQRYFVGI